MIVMNNCIANRNTNLPITVFVIYSLFDDSPGWMLDILGISVFEQTE